MGLSDFQPNRRLLDWPQDVLALVDGLNLERFAILAYSLGGPYGMACAFAIPEHLSKVGMVSGAALFTEPGLVPPPYCPNQTAKSCPIPKSKRASWP